MNFKRVATTIIGLPIVILLFIFGNKYIIDILFSIVTIISLYEYFNAFKDKAKPIKWLGYVTAILMSFIHLIPNEYIMNIIAMSIPTILIILFLHVIATNMKITLYDIMVTLFGIFYVAVFILFLPIIYGMNNGKINILYVFIIAWGTDTFAYLVGKRLGKHKFSEVSPKKSIEGCISGIIGAITLSLIYTYIVNTYMGMNISYINITLIAFILSIISQIGDFSASCIKRYVDIKDYGNLIPGHGGMLDRIDSVIFIAPFAYLLITLI